MRPVTIAVCSALFLTSTAAAQSPELDTSASPSTTVEEQAGQPQPVGVIDRFAASMYGLEPAGEPDVMTAAGRNEVILRAPMRLIKEGVLGGELAMRQVRMKQGSRVTYRRFTARTGMEAQNIEAWCGQGEIDQWGWRPTTVCMILTPDGRATLATPPLDLGSWWSVTAIAPTSASERVDRVEILPVEDPTPIDLELVLDRIRSGEVKLRRRLAGPDVTGERRVFPRIGDAERPLQPDGAATYVYDGLELRLTPNVEAKTVSIASARVAPPLDASFAEEGGLARRLEILTRPPEELQPTEFVVGGVRFDPSALVVDGSPLGPRGVLAKGTMSHARTGRVTQDIEMGTMLNARIPAGAAAHQVEIFRGLALGGRTSRFWCASVSALTVFGRQNDQLTCFRRAGEGYEGVWPDQGRTWLATTDQSTTPVFRRADALHIEESEIDLIGPMEVRLEIQRIVRDLITVRIFARRDEQDALVMTVTRLVENGQAVIPMWSHRLVLTVADGKAQASLTADGDGEGLPSVGTYP
ncbi:MULTISPECIES: hypothetical protein [Brevundimonas]|jgi:hypothetical protein|uniref:DUF4403 family protein n=1 Tax=Brevundimonas mediterranea TaxID=74329 RepID=A0A7Z9C6S9_9CAUL|nr:hypothetical protein [Brevundimonas sp.]VDC50148.1 hypothetical protein BREV_BREV_01717 [Brevundimonas mediterranea]